MIPGMNPKMKGKLNDGKSEMQTRRAARKFSKKMRTSKPMLSRQPVVSRNRFRSTNLAPHSSRRNLQSSQARPRMRSRRQELSDIGMGR